MMASLSTITDHDKHDQQNEREAQPPATSCREPGRRRLSEPRDVCRSHSALRQQTAEHLNHHVGG